MRIVRVMVGLLVLMWAVSCWAGSNDLGRVVATVNGADIKGMELALEIQQIIPMEASFHSGISRQKYQAIAKQALNELISRELQAQDAKAMGIKVDASVIDKEITQLQGQYKSKSEFEKIMRGSGFTDESLRHFLERRYLAGKAREAAVDAKVTVTDQMVKDYYDKNKPRYVRPEEFRVSHILIKVDPSSNTAERKKLRKRAEDILKKIKAGADFGQMAYKYSDDMSRIKDGDLGYFHAGRTLPEFEKAVKKLKVGEVSGIVQSLYGYHIIKLTDIRPQRQLSYEEMRDKIKLQLVNDQKKGLFEAWMKRLTSRAKITFPSNGSKG